MAKFLLGHWRVLILKAGRRLPPSYSDKIRAVTVLSCLHGIFGDGGAPMVEADFLLRSHTPH